MRQKVAAMAARDHLCKSLGVGSRWQGRLTASPLWLGEGLELQKHLFHYRRPAEEGGIGTAAEREYARTFFNRSR